MNRSKIALGYKKTGEKKLVGIVQIVTGEKVAKLTLVDTDKEGKPKTFANGETSIRVNLADLPKRPALKPNTKEPREYRVRMNQDGDAVESLGPVRGLFKARCTDLGKRENEGADPAPYEKVWNEGTAKENRYKEFFAVYEIIEGAFKGVALPAYNLHYKFEENPDDEGFARFNGNPENPKATRLHQLVEWGSVQGDIWSEPIRWPDDENILPELLERVLDADREVNVFIDKGYIQSVQPVEDYEDTEEVDVSDPEADAVDEMLDGDAEPVVETKKATKKSAPTKSKTYTTKRTEEDDDL